MFKLNVIVPTYNNTVKLIAAVDSILKGSANFDALVYIVDNNIPAGNPGVADNYFKDHSQIEVIAGERNGPCQARNLAVSRMRCADFVFFLDDDVIVPVDYFGRAIDSFQKTNSDAITFNTFLYYGRVWGRIKKMLAYLLYFGEIHDPRGLVNYVSKCNVVSGGNFAIKGNLADRIFWDEAYEGYSFAEDVDYGIRASRVINLNYDPSVNLYHNSVTKANSSKDLERRFLGLSYVLKKNVLFSAPLIVNYGLVIFVKSLKLRDLEFSLKLIFRSIPQVLLIRDPKKIMSLYLAL